VTKPIVKEITLRPYFAPGTSSKAPAVQDLARHYAAACKGDKTRAILMALDAGFQFTQVVSAFGDDGVRIAFRAIASGLISHGAITEEGKRKLREGAES
jgi:hypothetical protein